MEYKRIVLKLSGESLGKDGDGIDFSSIEQIINEIKPVYKKGISIGIVTGGGNIWRGAVDGTQIDRTAADYVGILATLVNGMVLGEGFKARGIPAIVFSPFKVNNFIEQFTQEKIKNAWKNKNIVIMTGGTGRPHFTTDTASAIFAVESKADAIFKATTVSGVYDDDPNKNPDAKLLKKVSFDEVINKNLKVMDMAAFSLCRQHKIKIVVFDFNKKGNIFKAVSGESVGSLIHN
ncbi:MAG: UMP kinase [Elusimicrobia bacterium RIFOXYD2_FULL_34_15]|nr:MAG: UMP kinase [Elusimicrobia bacterium RIFOXYD2_FULL_34_15]